MPVPSANLPPNRKPLPADRNRAVRLQTIRELDRLFREAGHPQFRGTIAVEIAVKEGRFNEPKLTKIQFGSTDDGS